jgi:hypothetical protein
MNKTCSEYQAELQHCIDQLMEVGRYEQALEFVALVGLPKDSVVISQVSVTNALCLHVAEGICFLKVVCYVNIP